MNVNKKLLVVLTSFFTLFLTASVGYSYTITASSGSGGSISPAGPVTVTAGADQTFFITPDLNNRVLDVDVDGVPEGPALSYTFTNVTADYTIEASFGVCDYSFPVLLEGFGYYDSIMTAYDDAFVSGLNAITLLLMEGALAHENLYFDADILVRLDGSYDCSFLSSTLATQISGSLTIAAGTVIPSGLGLSSSPLCEPGDPDNFPGNPEICDGLDNNCNGIADDGLGIDADSDGHYTFDTCTTFTPRDDCDDNDPNNFPGNPEICDSLDNNCDDQADEGLVPIDADGDGYTSLDSCGGSADDCNDNDADINPNGIEIFGDGIDQNCDGYDIRPSEQTCFTAGACHSVAGVDQLHASVPAPEPACIPCHRVREASVRTGHYGETVRTDGNNMLAGEEIRCVSCHDWHDPEFYTIPGAYFVWQKVHAVGRFNVTCFTCHENHPVDHQTGNAHDNRVIDPSCASCHTSDTSVLGSPGTGTLVSDEDVYALHRSDCYLCHAYEGTKLDPIIVDQMIINGLYGSLITCIDCHMDKGTGHGSVDHVALGYVTVGATSCTGCHDPGGAANATVSLTHNGDCALCHTTVPDLQPGVPAGGGDCTTCHTATWEALHPTAPDHTSLVTVGTTGCADCHSDPPPLVDPADAKVHNGCSSCHNTTTGALISSAIGKTFAVGGDCTTCHTGTWSATHTTDPGHTGITVGATGCASCHSDTPFIDPVDAKVHNSCTSCHDSGTGALIGSATGNPSPTDCTTCHTGTWAATHTTDPGHTGITVGATDCASCHSDTPFIDPADAKVHNGCASCHDSGTGALIGSATDNPSPTDCTTCHADPFDSLHAGHAHAVEVGSSDLSYDPPGTLCSSCHVVANWTEIEGTEHNVATNGAGSCATCHNSGRQEVIDTISLGANPTNCLDCHSNKNLTVHGNVDHVALGYVTLGATSCTSCHDPGGAANATVSLTHNGDCALCHTTVPDLQPGIPAGGGDCTTCHTGTWEATHTNDPGHTGITVGATDCASCHSDTPFIDPADAKVHNACTSCHDSGTGALIGSAIGNPNPTDCTTCHAGTWDATHTTDPGHTGITVGATDCASCHSDTPFIDAGDATNHNACTSCHDSGTGALTGSAIGNPTPTDCTTCHTGTWEATHTTAPSHNSLVTVGATSCASCHSDPPPLFDPADAKVHNACSSCHNSTTGALVSSAFGKTFAAGGDCTTCHIDPFDTLHAGHAHTVELDINNDLSNGQNCGNCHVVANWTEIEGTEHNVATNGAGSCATCHNSPRQEVIDTISAAADPTNCLDCHSDKTTGHGNIDHVAQTYVTVGGTQDYYGTTCASCHDPGGSANATVDVTHNGDCTLCHTTVPNLQPGVPAGGGDCATCHTSSVHTLWLRYMDTCSTSGCHNTFNGGPGGEWHDEHTAGWTSYPDSGEYPGPMWVSGFPLSPDCSTCHTAPTDDTRGQGCATCHTFESKGDAHLRHSWPDKKGGLGINCQVCHVD